MAGKRKKDDRPFEQQEEEEINKTLLEDSLALAGTERQVNEGYDIEERMRRIEGLESEVVKPAPKKKMAAKKRKAAGKKAAKKKAKR